MQMYLPTVLSGRASRCQTVSIMTRLHRAWGSSYDVDLTLVPSTVALPVWHYPCARPWVWKCDISLGGPRRTINDLQNWNNKESCYCTGTRTSGSTIKCQTIVAGDSYHTYLNFCRMSIPIVMLNTYFG